MKSTKSGGIGFTGVLTLVFIVLKLCGVIEWGLVMGIIADMDNNINRYCCGYIVL